MPLLEGTFKSVIEIALFVFAAIQGMGSFLGILDRHRAIQTAKAEGRVSTLSKWPFGASVLAAGAAGFILLGFWMILHPTTSSIVPNEGATKQAAKNGTAEAAPGYLPAKSGGDQPEPAKVKKPNREKAKPSLSSIPNQSGQENHQATAISGGTAQVMTGSPGGIQAGGDVNIFGAPKLAMNDTQRDAISIAMRPFSGINVWIFCHDATDDSLRYAGQLAIGLRAAGIAVQGPDPGMALSTAGTPSGISLDLGDERIDAAKALIMAMQKVGLITNAIPAAHSPAKDKFQITIAPNR